MRHDRRDPRGCTRKCCKEARLVSDQESSTSAQCTCLLETLASDLWYVASLRCDPDVVAVAAFGVAQDVPVLFAGTG